MTDGSMTPATIELIERVDGDTKLWAVVSAGDLSGLTPAQKSDYYRYRCARLGIDPSVQPFVFMKQDGREFLYGGKNLADQLRNAFGLTLVSATCTRDDDYIEWEVTLEDLTGRRDFDIGVVFVGNQQGIARANNRMKALTKAKRRATISLTGAGVPDETEVEDFTPNAKTEAVNSGAVYSARKTRERQEQRATVPEIASQGTNGDADVNYLVDPGDVVVMTPPKGSALIVERPDDMAGLGEDGEIVDAETGEITGPEHLATNAQWARLNELRKQLGMPTKVNGVDALHSFAMENGVPRGTTRLSAADADRLIEEMQQIFVALNIEE